MYGGHFLLTFPILDADGDPVTGATGLDSEVSKDLGTFTDCTNEATEIATNSGIYYLYLTGAEMTAKMVTVRVQTSSSGAKTTVLNLYPIRLPVLESGTATAGAGSTITLAAAANATNSYYNGLMVQISNNGAAGSQYQTRRIVSYVGSTKVATVDSAWGTNPSSASTYDILVPDGHPNRKTAVDVWSELINASTYNVVDTAGRRLRDLASTGITILTGTAQAGSTATTIVLASTASTTNDIYNGSTVLITGGTGVGQTRRIVDYVGSTRRATVDKVWVTTPDATSTFSVLAAPNSVTTDEGTAQAGGAATITLATTASSNDSAYTGAFVTLTAGTGAGQTREISGYVGSTRVATVSAVWDTQPDSTSVYAVTPNATTASDATPAPTAEENALALLTLDLSGVSGEASRSVINALRAIRNKWSIAAGVITVYEEDDTTAAWTGVVGTAAGNNVSSIDPS